MAQTLEYNLERIGIDVHVKYFDVNAIKEKVSARGEPFDLFLTGWGVDYADSAGYFVPLLGRGSGDVAINPDDPAIHARIDAADRLTGEARRKAWADLDIDLMRINPPWAPYVHFQSRTFISRSTGCFFPHPLYGFDIAAVCKKR